MKGNTQATCILHLPGEIPLQALSAHPHQLGGLREDARFRAKVGQGDEGLFLATERGTPGGGFPLQRGPSVSSVAGEARVRGKEEGV